MSHLPPVGWSDVATKQDLAALGTRLDARFETVEAKFDARFETLDAKFDVFDARFEAIDAKFEPFDAKFGSRVDGLRTEFHQELASQLRWILGSTMTAMLVLTGLFAIVVGVLA